MTDASRQALEPFTRRALLQEPVLSKAVAPSSRDQNGLAQESAITGSAERHIRCLTCERRCEIRPDAVGWCRTRRNQDGELVTLIYGAVSSLSCNPIEKKPLYHFHPGTLALTSGSFSCNFDCPWCQNHHVSKAPPGGGRFVSPREFVLLATDWRCQGTSISFNEPTLSLEWSLEVFELARERGLYNTFVSNGYMTPDALGLLVEAGLDGINVDIKGDAQAVKRYCGIEVEKVWRNCRLAQEEGVWLEITTLIVPGVNDGEVTLQGIAERIVTELGADTPWHVNAYYPAYRFTAPPTPVAILERAWQLGHEAGLRFVYGGNLPGTSPAHHRLQDTFCPDCSAPLIQRRGLGVTSYHLDRGRCPGCGYALPGVWDAGPRASA